MPQVFVLHLLSNKTINLEEIASPRLNRCEAKNEKNETDIFYLYCNHNFNNGMYLCKRNGRTTRTAV